VSLVPNQFGFLELQSEITYGVAGKYLYAPALARNHDGNLLVVYNQSSYDEYPSIYATGRRTGDPVGTLRPPHGLKAATAPYVYGSGFEVARWGDVSGAAVDSNGLDFWLAAEYADGDVFSSYGTWIVQAVAANLPP
jgi:hypothetical protein